jgi:integrase
MPTKKVPTTWHGGGIYSRPRKDKEGEYAQYFVRVTVDKRPRIFKAGRTLTSAKRLRDRVRGNPAHYVEKREKAAAATHSGMTMQALFDNFLKHYRSRGGTRYYVERGQHTMAHFGKLPLSSVNYSTLDKYLRWARTQKWKDGTRRLSESTLRKDVIAMTKVFRWAKGRRLVDVNPLLDYEKPKEPAGHPARALTADEETKVLALLPPLERDVVTWALDSGMRIGEIRTLKWTAIDKAANAIHVGGEKGGNKTNRLRVVPLDLSPRLLQVLDRHPRRTTTELVFHTPAGEALDRSRVGRVLHAAFEAAGVPRMRGKLWNALRSTWCQRIYAEGAEAQDEAAWAGHTMQTADKHYRKYSPKARAMASGLLSKYAVASGVASSG